MIPANRAQISKKDVLKSLWYYGTTNPISELESSFSRYLGIGNPLYTSYCRNALYLTYKSLKTKGEIIVSPLTCSLGILPIIYAGLIPRFVDIDPKTYNIDPNAVNESINQNTVGIQTIHLGGNPCEMDTITEISKDNNLLLVEDCAQSLGAEYRGQKVGTFGDISCFNLTKNIYGIGGMLVTNDKTRYYQIRECSQEFPINSVSNLSNYISYSSNSSDLLMNAIKLIKKTIKNKQNDGKNEEKGEDFYDMQNKRFFRKSSRLEASLCLVKIKQLEELLEKRIENAQHLKKGIKDIEGVKLQSTTNNSKNIYTKFMIQTNRNNIDIIRKLRKEGVEATHLKTGREEFQERFDRNMLYSKIDSLKKCKNYFDVHDSILCLPISPNMNQKELDIISEKLKQVLI